MSDTNFPKAACQRFCGPREGFEGCCLGWSYPPHCMQDTSPQSMDCIRRQIMREDELSQSMTDFPDGWER